MGAVNESVAGLRPPGAQMGLNFFKEGHLRHVRRVSLEDQEKMEKVKC